jgi:hypothetical protein
MAEYDSYLIDNVQQGENDTQPQVDGAFDLLHSRILPAELSFSDELLLFDGLSLLDVRIRLFREHVIRHLSRDEKQVSNGDGEQVCRGNALVSSISKSTNRDQNSSSEKGGLHI